MHISHVCTNFRIIYSFLWYVTEPHVYSSIPLLDIIFGIQILSHPYQSKTQRFLYTRATFPIEYQPTLQPLWKKIDGWRRRRKRASLLDSESPRRTTTILVHAGPAEISIDKRWEQIQVKIAGERVCMGTRARRVTPRRYICSNASTSSPPAKTRRARTERRRFGENPIKITGLSLSPSLLGRQRGSIAGEEFEREEKKGRKRERRRRQQSAIKIAPFQHCFLSLARARGGDSTAAVARGIYSRQTGWLACARVWRVAKNAMPGCARLFTRQQQQQQQRQALRRGRERFFLTAARALLLFARERETKDYIRKGRNAPGSLYGMGGWTLRWGFSLEFIAVGGAVHTRVRARAWRRRRRRRTKLACVCQVRWFLRKLLRKWNNESFEVEESIGLDL